MMTVYEVLTLLIAFGGFVIFLLTFIFTFLKK